MMRLFPLRVDDRPFPELYNAIAGAKPHLRRSEHNFEVRPLVPMVVDVIGDLAKEDALGLQNTVGLAQEGWIEM